MLSKRRFLRGVTVAATSLTVPGAFAQRLVETAVMGNNC
jgi:hypothetical protein